MNIFKQHLNSIWQKAIYKSPCTFYLAILIKIWYLAYFIQGSVFSGTPCRLYLEAYIVYNGDRVGSVKVGKHRLPIRLHVHVHLPIGICSLEAVFNHQETESEIWKHHGTLTFNTFVPHVFVRFEAMTKTALLLKIWQMEHLFVLCVSCPSAGTVYQAEFSAILFLLFARSS